MKDVLYKLTIDSLFECPNLFTKEEWKSKIEEKDVNVKDIDLLIELFLEKKIIKSINENIFQITVEEAFNNIKTL